MYNSAWDPSSHVHTCADCADCAGVHASLIPDQASERSEINDSDPVCKRETSPRSITMKGTLGLRAEQSSPCDAQLDSGLDMTYIWLRQLNRRGCHSQWLSSQRNRGGMACNICTVLVSSSLLGGFCNIFYNFYPVANVCKNWCSAEVHAWSRAQIHFYTLTHKGLRLLRYDVYLSSWSRITASKVEWFYLGEIVVLFE